MITFNFNRYLKRAGKYLVYLIIVFVLVIAIFSLTSKQSFSIYNLFRPGTGIQIAVFLLVMSIIYPFFGYSSKKVYLNKTFAQDKDKINEVFERNRFVVECEEGNQIKYRHSSLFVRIIRMNEDRITLDFSDNPIVLDGQRKDVYRIARMIEYAVRDDRNDDY